MALGTDTYIHAYAERQTDHFVGRHVDLTLLYRPVHTLCDIARALVRSLMLSYILPRVDLSLRALTPLAR